MPTTITSTDLTVFQNGATCVASEVNSNFDLVRGDFLSIDENTSAAADLTYDLGSTSYRWAEVHAREYRISDATTAGNYFTVNTAGTNVQLYVGGTLSAAWDNTGNILGGGGGGGTITIGEVFPRSFTSTMSVAGQILKTSSGFDTTSVILISPTGLTCTVEFVASGTRPVKVAFGVKNQTTTMASFQEYSHFTINGISKLAALLYRGGNVVGHSYFAAFNATTTPKIAFPSSSIVMYDNSAPAGITTYTVHFFDQQSTGSISLTAYNIALYFSEEF